jgi:hypothetical protein
MSIPEKRLATSDDVPRAVEYLIQLVLCGVLWVMSFGFGVGALVCFLEHWPLYVSIPLAVVSALTAVACWAIKSSPGRLVIGSSTGEVGIVVPRSDRDASSSSRGSL